MESKCWEGNEMCFLREWTSLLASAALRSTELFHFQKEQKILFSPETVKLSKTPNVMSITNNSAVGESG